MSQPFFNYAAERYLILLRRRRGEPPPWTKDPILGRYRFCNLFREDDTTTRWIAKNLRNPIAESGNFARLITVMCAARFINRVDTLIELAPMLLSRGWDSEMARRILYARRKRGLPIVTGAYLIRTPSGMDKIMGLDHILTTAQQSSRSLARNMAGECGTLKRAHQLLTQLPGFGGFMAYEVITDLRHTPLLNQADDIMTWAYAGPGATRGAGRVVNGNPHHFSRNRDQEKVCQVMQQLLREANCYVLWPKWEMRDVEHTLCEFDKYERARLGQGAPKQKYEPPIGA